MAVKRFTATADTTVTNAFLEDLMTRATGANLGLSDSLEVYSIYGQASSSFGSGYSSELSRILLKFPVLTSDDGRNSIQAQRASGSIPVSGSVTFYFKLYNVAHHETLATNPKFNIFAVSSSWQEGRGMDLDTYEDKTFDGEGANWINANGNAAAATATIKIVGSNASTIDDGSPPSITLTSTDGTERTYAFQNGGSYANGASAGDTTVRWYGTDGSASTQGGMAALLKTAIEGSAGHNGKLTVALSTVTNTNDTLTITQATKGIGGNLAIPAVTNGNASDLTVNGAIVATKFVDGNGPWANVGGDYHTGSVDADLNSAIMYDQTLPLGNEDIEVDITHLVERWIRADPGYSNYGIGVFLTSSQEAYLSSSTGADLPRVPPDNGGSMSIVSGGIPHNLEGAKTSYYTKKFSSRGSEYFFKRPVIEARWDSSIKDDRGSFYYSSSLASPSENLNTIYFYNYFRGQLRNIPLTSGQTDNNLFYVSFFSGNLDNTEPTGTALLLVDDKTHVNAASTNMQAVTGGYASPGIYSASVSMTAAATPLNKIFDVWWKGATNDHVSSSTAVHYYTGSFEPQKLDASPIAPYTQYASSITNLRDLYRNIETARFRVYTRRKDWAPTIYTKATSIAEVNIVESGSYEVYRIVDDLKVLPFGTGSLLHTRMSFDASGSYFDLDMDMFEPGYMYGIRLSYYNNSVRSWVEQPETFKFRVEK
jgi:hypothetical protein